MATVIYGLLKEEKERNLEMQEIHLREINSLPKGAIVTKTTNGRKYYYLRYRDKNKVRAVYLGSNESALEEIRFKIARRKHLLGVVKRLKLEYKQICKIVKE